ncbi:MAG TPA: type II and III secretion system protein family protein [Vicinamibacterales bacterium]|nr:type II and III secretion system protein family protein [Vicinamibacterales bacterium]
MKGPKTFLFILLIAVFHPGWLMAQSPELTAVALSAKADASAPMAVRILAGRSAIVDTGTPITRVSLTSADIADALVTSSQQLLVHGKTPGTISMFVWSRAGGVQRYEVSVQRDVARVSEQIHTLFPKETIAVESNGRNIVLAGTVPTKEIADRAVDVAAGFVDKRDEVVSLLQVAPVAGVTNQVMLRVRFAEVSRSALTEAGVSFFTSPTGVRNTIGRVTTQQFPAPGFEDLKYGKDSADFGAPVKSADGKFSFSDFLNLFLFSEKYDLGLMIKALQARGLFQSLAEPNLVAESGKEASFLAGGEFPVPIWQGGNTGGISVTFKEFGIRLNFTPTVVEGDRVHLKVRPEVSTLDFTNAVVLQGFRIPALSTRRTETELELRNGQTFAIAGLLNNTLNSTLQKIPGIGDIPILGQLFRSKAAQKDRTELVVMITPEILRTESPGVTDALPRMNEPYLSPTPQNQSIAPPPPAFQTPSR